MGTSGYYGSGFHRGGFYAAWYYGPSNPFDTIHFAETYSATVKRFVRTADSIRFTDFVAKGKLVIDSINFNDLVTGKVVHFGSASDAIHFSEIIRSIRSRVSVSDVITLSDAANRPGIRSVSDTIHFSEARIGQDLKVVSDSVHFTEAYAKTVIVKLHVADAIVLSDGVNQTGVIFCDNYTTTLGIRSKFTLFYPPVSPTLTQDLRNPQFGNQNKVDTNAVVRRTRTGQLISFRASTWPTMEAFKYKFVGLSKATRDSLVSFLAQTSGKLIGIMDHENRSWTGVVVNAQVPTMQAGPGCQYEAELEIRVS